MKKSIAFIVMLAFIFVALTAIIINIKHPKSKNNGEKIEVVATLFPQYDFAKQVGGDKVNVTLLLPPGTESHTYEPTPQDMVMIDQSNLFIYTGEEMEPWAENLISGMKNNINVLDLSKSVELINVEEFEEEHENDEEHHHHEEDEDDNEHEHSHEDEHHHTYDPHIWLNPQYAVKMVRSIEQELGKIDPDNAEYYKTNADNYIRQIMDLDAEFEETVRNAQNPKLAFGGAFAYAYFVERYSLDF
ncbi:MAG: zinc ABC transporter substrate-binding protein, partial [Clostridia bacterium]|nr:zinc ABC transporter substrate-binding protein [Clostridia bacterium]